MSDEKRDPSEAFPGQCSDVSKGERCLLLGGHATGHDYARDRHHPASATPVNRCAAEVWERLDEWSFVDLQSKLQGLYDDGLASASAPMCRACEKREPTMCSECFFDDATDAKLRSSKATPVPDDGFWGAADEIIQLIDDNLPANVAGEIHKQVVQVLRRRATGSASSGASDHVVIARALRQDADAPGCSRARARTLNEIASWVENRDWESRLGAAPCARATCPHCSHGTYEVTHDRPEDCLRMNERATSDVQPCEKAASLRSEDGCRFKKGHQGLCSFDLDVKPAAGRATGEARRVSKDSEHWKRAHKFIYDRFDESGNDEDVYDLVLLLDEARDLGRASEAAQPDALADAYRKAIEECHRLRAIVVSRSADAKPECPRPPCQRCGKPAAPNRNHCSDTCFKATVVLEIAQRDRERGQKTSETAEPAPGTLGRSQDAATTSRRAEAPKSPAATPDLPNAWPAHGYRTRPLDGASLPPGTAYYCTCGDSWCQLDTADGAGFARWRSKHDAHLAGLSSSPDLRARAMAFLESIAYGGQSVNGVRNLEALLTEVRRETIDACAKEAESPIIRGSDSLSHYGRGRKEAADDIRSLLKGGAT